MPIYVKKIAVIFYANSFISAKYAKNVDKFASMCENVKQADGYEKYQTFKQIESRLKDDLLQFLFFTPIKKQAMRMVCFFLVGDPTGQTAAA